MNDADLIKLKAEILARKGKYGLQRFERALDEIPNLHRMFTYEALRDAFIGDNARALMTMNPSRFEDYATRLPGTDAEQGKGGGTRGEYIADLAGLTGFSDVPYLTINKDEQGLPITPYIAGHEGRHRSRALTSKGVTKSLVELLPRYELREGFPRREQGEYIDALRKEMAMTGNKVIPQSDRKENKRPAIDLPDLYAEGGDVVRSPAIRAFHGTADDFVKFQLGHPNRKDVGWLGHGLYFTNSPEMAMANAKMKAARKGPKAAPRVMSVRLNIQNPYYATLEDKARLQKANSSDASMAFTEALKGKGHDGVIWKSGDYHEYVAFHPDQVEVLPEEKAEGGKVDSDLKTAQRLGMDTSSIPEIRKAGQLREAHKSLGEKVRERAEESYKRALEYHQSGKLPFPVGTRFITEKTRKMNQLPFKVVGHYVDGKDPDRYGYRTEQGNKGDPNYSSSLLMVSDPAGDARMEKIGKPFDRKAWWDSVQVLKGPTQVKAEGGPVTLDEMRLALINAPKMARGGRLTSRLPTLGNEGEIADVVPPKLQGTNIVKEKGGQWLEGSLNPAIYNLESKGPTEADRAWIEQHFQQQPDNQEAKKVALSAIPVTEAINGWVNSTLRKYIMRDMGTEGDPVRALAERGILHVNPEQLNFKTEAHGKWLKPGQRHVAKSEEAKAWEGASDLQLSSSPASVITATNDRAVEDNPWLASIDPNTPIHSVTDSRELRRDLGFDHLVDELQNAVRQDSNLPQNLRLRPESMQRMSVPQAVEHVHKINQWRADNIAKANREKAFNSAVKLHKDYPDSDYAWYEIGQSPEATPAIPDKTEPRWGVYNTRLPQSGFKSREEAEGYIQQLANMREELVKRGESPETINEIFGNLSPQIEDYNQVVERGSPSSDERLKEALKYEGDAMGHCVGGYSDEVASGNSRIFSLRNKKTGAPHVTIETKPAPLRGGQSVEEYLAVPHEINQIKGKGNAKPVARYIPYVQDFVKSGKWSDVNDSQNAGLRKYTDVFNVNEQRLLEQKGAQVPDHLYLTGDQIQQMHNMIHQPGKRLKYDATGNIIGNDADSGYAKGGPISLNEMKLALLDRKAGGGQPERKVSPIGFYSPAAEAARNLPQETGTPEQMAAMLAKQRGVSDEMQHSGYGQKMTAPKVSRQDLVAHFESQMPDVQETVLGEGRVKSFEEWLADQGLSPSAVNEFGGTLRRSYEAFKNNNSQRAGGHKYSEHQLPGGENYREVLLTLPEKPKKETWEWYDPIEQESKQGFATQQEAYANRPNIGAVVSKVEAKDSPQNYQSPHWDQPNVLAHIRLNDRTDAEGKKVLFVEEMQSDWGQQGKKKGFYDPNKKPLSRKEFDSYTDNLLNDYVERQIQAGEDVHSANRRGMHTPFPQMAQELGRAEEYAGMRERRDIGMNSNARIPSAPFVTNTNHWVNLALKRIAKMAVDGGYDKVAFVNGNQSADRYDLSKQVGSVHYFPEGDGVGKGTLIAMPIGEDINSSSESAMTHDNVAPEDLSKYVGKEVAEKMLNAPKVNGMHSVSGEGLKVGGEGMKAFYDKIVPAAINKLLPKIGGKKLGAVHLVNKAHDFDLDDLGNATPEELAQLEAGGVILHQPGFEVTPEMREHVQKGLPIFKTGGVMRGYAGGGTAQGTTMPTLAQMKMALMGLPKNLGSIGAQEAPDMNPKAYFPPDRQGRLPPGGAALTSGMPIGGIDMSSQMGQQLMPQQLMPQQGAQSPQGVQNPQVGPQEQGGLAAPQEAPQEPQQASSSGILGLTPQGQTMGALKPPMKAARGGGINYPTIDPKTLQNENDGANLQPVNWMGGGDVEGMAKGGEFKFSIKPSGLAKTSSGNFTPYDDQRPSIKTLATAFNEAIAHHLSLSPEDRVANSQRAANAVAEHIGRTQQGKPKDLLGKNAKLVKTEKGGSEAIKLPDNRGVETTGLALSPAYQEKQFQTCPNHASCKAECLGKTSGNYFKLGGGDDLTAFKGPRLNSLRKTQAFLRDPHSFAVKLYDEIQAAKDMAAANGNHLGVRLNVLSDISPLVHESIIKGHPDVTFYDYTKNKSNPIAENHHYTYSSTGVSQPGVENPNTNWARMRKRLENGENVAMAFSHKEHLPTEVHDQETGKVYRVVNGDTHDFRPLDIQPEGESGVIIGLKNKKATGKVSNAHKDSKGFFVHYDPQLKMNPNGTYQRSSVPRVTKEGKPKLGETIPQNTRVNIMPQGKVAEAFDNDGEKA